MVLNFFSPDDHSSSRQYREYILLNQSLEDPFKQTYHNIALGDDDFIQKINVKIENQKSSREIPITNSTSSYNPKEIIETLCAANQIEHKRLMSKVRGNIYRSLALYLIKKLTPLKLNEIGELFAMEYPAISQAVKRFEQKCKTDKEAERIKDKTLDALKIS